MALALVSAMVFGLLAAAPVQAATYNVKTEGRYSYQDGKWVKEGSSSYTYDSKGRRLSSKDQDIYYRWDDEKQKSVKLKLLQDQVKKES